MARILPMIVWWESVQDAYAYPIRLVPDGQPFDKDAPIDALVFHDPDLAEHEFDLSQLDIPEGKYDIYITASDNKREATKEAGNETDPLELADAVLDFTPPSGPPAAGGFR